MTIPMSGEEVIDRYFLEIRCKLLEVAASLDRVDRGQPAGVAREDARMDQLRRAIGVLLEEGPGRAEKVQLIFSRPYDPNWRQT